MSNGERLDAVVARRPEVSSRAVAQRLIEEGRVTVDGAPSTKGHRVRPGERIEVDVEDAPGAAPEPVPFEVAYEDEHLMVVDKPAGVVVHPAPGHHGPTLAEALAGRAAGGSDPERAG